MITKTAFRTSSLVPLLAVVPPILAMFLGVVGLVWYGQHIDDGINIFRRITTLADLDGDGDSYPDIFAGGHDAEYMVSLNQGSGTFQIANRR